MSIMVMPQQCLEDKFIYDTVPNKLSIRMPKPNGKVYSATIGKKKIGHDAAMEIAITKVREVGSKMWAEFWSDILNNPTLLKELPHSVEPTLTQEKDRHGKTVIIYRAIWTVESNGKRKRVCKKTRVNTHGYEESYRISKQQILIAYDQWLPLIRFLKENDNPRFVDSQLELR